MRPLFAYYLPISLENALLRLYDPIFIDILGPEAGSLTKVST